jgi:hypothetical protein
VTLVEPLLSLVILRPVDLSQKNIFSTPSSDLLQNREAIQGFDTVMDKGVPTNAYDISGRYPKRVWTHGTGNESFFDPNRT